MYFCVLSGHGKAKSLSMAKDSEINLSCVLTRHLDKHIHECSISQAPFPTGMVPPSVHFSFMFPSYCMSQWHFVCYFAPDFRNLLALKLELFYSSKYFPQYRWAAQKELWPQQEIVQVNDHLGKQVGPLLLVSHFWRGCKMWKWKKM